MNDKFCKLIFSRRDMLQKMIFLVLNCFLTPLSRGLNWAKPNCEGGRFLKVKFLKILVKKVILLMSHRVSTAVI